jgi:hypothetical protein
MIDTNGGGDTDGYDSDYDRVTARDIADFLHHLAELRNGHAESVIDPAQRAAFLSRKADLFGEPPRFRIPDPIRSQG